MSTFERDLDNLDEDARARAVLAELDRATGAACASCGHALCGHEAMVSLVCGYKAAPRCLACVAADMTLTPVELRDRTWRYVHGRDCFLQGWREASRREGFPKDARPPCLWSEPSAAAGATPAATPATSAEDSTTAPATVAANSTTAPQAAGAGSNAAAAADSEWNAGTMACGELVLELRIRLAALPKGAVLLLTAFDPAAPEDIPAWCRLTGNQLVRGAHPRYWIRAR